MCVWGIDITFRNMHRYMSRLLLFPKNFNDRLDNECHSLPTFKRYIKQSGHNIMGFAMILLATRN